MKHAEIPWHDTGVPDPDGYSVIGDTNGYTVCHCECGESNIKFIIKACNSYDAHVEALKEAQSLLYHSGYEMTDDKCIMPKSFFGDAMTVLEKINNVLEQINI